MLQNTILVYLHSWVSLLYYTDYLEWDIPSFGIGRRQLIQSLVFVLDLHLFLVDLLSFRDTN